MTDPLFTPGPVDFSEAAGRALTLPSTHHRSEGFERVWQDFGRDLSAAFRTRNPVVILTASATGAMEAVVANLTRPGDRILVAVNGKFSRRWVAIGEAYGLKIVVIEIPLGQAASAEVVARGLADSKDVAAVFVTQCETSTGSLTELAPIAAAVRDYEFREGKQVLVASDSATGLLVDPLETDAWGLDAVVGASQKGLLAPPGLGFVALSPRALGLCRKPASPRFYFDFRKYLDSERPPFTPAVQTVLAAAASLKYVLGLGLERVWKANRAAADALRLIVEAAGFKPVAEHPSAAVVAFWVGGLDPEALASVLARDHGIVVAQGQDELAGKALRISGIGKTPREISLFAGAFAASLSKLGRSCDLSGTATRLEAILEDARIWESQP